MTSTVLVIDDDLPIRTTLRVLLESEGYAVLTAANGRDGLETLRLNPQVKLILLDLMMPVMDGWEFLEAKAAAAEHAATPVIAMTGATHASPPAKAERFVNKPLDVHRLLAAIKEYVETRGPQ